MNVRAPHSRRPMTGRDPHEDRRAATPLELLFDLAAVVAISAASGELAHAMSSDHIGRGLVAFALCMFAICWAWISFTWFASAYDNDDWAFRLLTMVQMGGVIIVALGIPDVFSSIIEHDRLDLDVPVAGYVVMRVALVGLWIRAARNDPPRRAAITSYVVTILIGQLLWCLLLIPDLGATAMLSCLAVPVLVELAGPVIAERRHGGTPWHAHHIAERYGLLVIITLGEAVIGTVAAISAFVHVPEIGWTTDAVVVLASGVLLTLGMWWTYFSIPWGQLLHLRRERSFFWGYGHFVIFSGIAASGAGLHAAQYYLERHSTLGVLGTTLAVAVPVAVYVAMLYLMYAISMRAPDPLHVVLVILTAAVIVASVLMAAADVSLPVCLAVLAFAPVVTIVGFETLGHRHLSVHLEHNRQPRQTVSTSRVDGRAR